MLCFWYLCFGFDVCLRCGWGSSRPIITDLPFGLKPEPTRCVQSDNKTVSSPTSCFSQCQPASMSERKLRSTRSMISKTRSLHSCSYCQGICLYLDLKSISDMAEGHPMRILSDFNLADIEEAASHDCRFCEWLLEERKLSPPNLNLLHLPHNLYLCADFDTTDRADLIGPFGLWSKTNAKVMEIIVSSRHYICTAAGM